MIVAMTIYDRTPEVIRAVFAGLSLPGNRPDAVAVCYDRAPDSAWAAVRSECFRLHIELREYFLDDDFKGPRCPSLAWNSALSLVDEDHAFCISSDVVLAPHSVGMAYHMSEVFPQGMIVGRVEHCGQSYAWEDKDKMLNRTISWSGKPSGLGFSWLLPMAEFRAVSGYDEIYMDGYCYEDDDFVLRMWKSGSDFLYCDDIMGFHLEHKRDHLLDKDGRVTINADIFTKRFGDLYYLRDRKFQHVGARLNVGMTLILHEKNEETVKQCFNQQKLYCQEAPWRAIPVNFA